MLSFGKYGSGVAEFRLSLSNVLEIDAVLRFSSHCKNCIRSFESIPLLERKYQYNELEGLFSDPIVYYTVYLITFVRGN
jgi:hypothetical protein